MSRDSVVDNAKGALIVLVITGHLIEGLMDKSEYYRALFSAIYLFHMPMFVFITGMFSKGSFGFRELRSLFSRIAIPFVVFQLLYVGVTSIAAGHRTTPLLWPYWILWFLVSVMSWKLLLPIVLRLRGSMAIALLIGIAIGAGYVHAIGRTLSFSRTLMFFPVFLVGHLYGKALISWVRRHRLLGCILFVLLEGATGLIYFFSGAPHQPLLGHVPYSEISQHLCEPGLERALILIAGLVTSVAGFALVPESNRFLTYLGRRTLTIFIMHGFVMLLAWHVFSTANLLPTFPLVPLIFAASIAIATVLAIADAPLNRLFDDSTSKVMTSLGAHLNVRLDIVDVESNGGGDASTTGQSSR
jgi:fucose 4-O-acetylase-like acetyltransferase